MVKQKITLTISGGVDKPLSRFSSVVSKANALSVFPNPANNNLTLSFTVAQAATTEFECKDMTGRIMAYEKFQSTSGDNSKTVSLQDYPAGIYVVQLKVERKFLLRE